MGIVESETSTKLATLLERKGISRGNASPTEIGFHVEMNSERIAPSRCVGRALAYRFVIRVTQFERLVNEGRR